MFHESSRLFSLQHKKKHRDSSPCCAESLVAMSAGFCNLSEKLTTIHRFTWNQAQNLLLPAQTFHKKPFKEESSIDSFPKNPYIRRRRSEGERPWLSVQMVSSENHTSMHVKKVEDGPLSLFSVRALDALWVPSTDKCFSWRTCNNKRSFPQPFGNVCKLHLTVC